MTTRQDRRSDKPLAGITAVITRPAGSAAALGVRARALGCATLNLPGLRLRAAMPDTPARDALQAPDAFDTWIFTSPAAVRFACGLVPTLAIPRPARVIAIGAGTRRALARHGIVAASPAQRADSEGVLALDELADVRGSRVAIVGAPGGRDAIAPALRTRGAQVEHVHVYERGRPVLGKRQLDAVRAADDPLFTLISSGEALANLVALLPADLLERLRAQTLIASSERLAGIARGFGFEGIAVACSALPRDLLDAMRTARVRQRR